LLGIVQSSSYQDRNETQDGSLMAVVWVVAWLLLGVAGLVPGGSAAVVIVLVFHGFFGLGETLMQSALPALTNEMRPRTSAAGTTPSVPARSRAAPSPVPS
jgi:hypothetical protein